nr:immunoglobulin heavy chain junction region [Mus musculus]
CARRVYYGSGAWFAYW